MRPDSHAAEALEPGTRLGSYRVVRLIARGGMGAVYEAEQSGTGARRALKVMHGQLAGDPRLRRQFVQEARLAASIKSDHVAQVIDAGVEEATDRLYLAMELLEGVTMSRALRQRGAFSWPEVAEIVRQLCHALSAAHDAGIVHRDLKPANVFFATPRTAGVAFMVKVLDFGIAKLFAETAAADAVTAILGTPAWMAPEQTESGAPIGPPADVWSLGLLAFALLTGKHFWPSANHKGATAVLLREMVIDEIPSASVRAAGYELGGHIPPGFDAWMSRCVVRAPQGRHPDARAAYQAFLALVGPACGVVSSPPSSGPFSASSGPFPAHSPASWLPIAATTALPSEPPGGTPEASLAFDKPTVSYASRPDRAPPRPRNGRAWVAAAVALSALGALGAGGVLLARELSRRSAAAASAVGSPPVPSAPPLPSAPRENVVLRLHGSNTIGAELAPALAEAFLARRTGAAHVVRRPGAAEEMRVEARREGEAPDVIEIQAHGSSTAFEDLGKDTCDIGMSSRRITDVERERLSSRGNLASAASEHVIALDGIAVIVNPENAVTTLTREQIARLFAGEVKAWSEVAGSGSAVSLLARDDRSGTFDSFRHLVLGQRKLVPEARRFASSEHLSDAVAADAGAIGFIGLPYVRSAKAVMVQDEGSVALLPSPMTIATEDYPLARRLYLYTPQSAPEEARRFVDFALSEEGQRIVERAGFVDLRPECDAGAQHCTGCTRAYRDAVAQSCRLSVDFRFDFGQQKLDTRALRDLARVASVLGRPESAGRAVVLIGFSDDIGTRHENTQLSRERAELVAAQLRARGLFVKTVLGFGPDMPVASNRTAEGRERNRRVEIWLQ